MENVLKYQKFINENLSDDQIMNNLPHIKFRNELNDIKKKYNKKLSNFLKVLIYKIFDKQNDNIIHLSVYISDGEWMDRLNKIFEENGELKFEIESESGSFDFFSIDKFDTDQLSDIIGDLIRKSGIIEELKNSKTKVLKNINK